MICPFEENSSFKGKPFLQKEVNGIITSPI
jgi:hypothetical protein